VDRGLFVYLLFKIQSVAVRGGLTAQEVAIDRVYDFYGRAESVTTIINKMKNHRRNGILLPF
jgi:hypothetical protein